MDLHRNVTKKVHFFSKKIFISIEIMVCNFKNIFRIVLMYVAMSQKHSFIKSPDISVTATNRILNNFF